MALFCWNISIHSLILTHPAFRIVNHIRFALAALPFISHIMRSLALLVASLGAFALASNADPTNAISSMAAAASKAAAAAESSFASEISSERAGQTLSGAAASEASHNSQVYAAATSAQAHESSIISVAEASVLSQESKQIASLKSVEATATGEFKQIVFYTFNG